MHFADARTFGPTSANRNVSLPGVSSPNTGGGKLARAPDGTRAVVVGREVIRIVRVRGPEEGAGAAPHEEWMSIKTSAAGPGGWRAECSVNYWKGNHLKIDSASTDVRWAAGPYSTKVVTSSHNGYLFLWDMSKGHLKIERRFKAHARSIHAIAYSPTYLSPHLIVSASQDGHARLWDLRAPDHAVRYSPPSGQPIRSICLLPASPQFGSSTSSSSTEGVGGGVGNGTSLLCGMDSGNIIRFDLRSRRMTERVVLAHKGPVTSLDFRPSAYVLASRMESSPGHLTPIRKATKGTIEKPGLAAGWIASGGADRCIKVWDLTQTGLATRPVYTLHAQSTVLKAEWRPGREWECELGVIVGSDGSDDPRGMEIWDVRRGWIPKWHIKPEGSGRVNDNVTDLSFADETTIWAQYSSGRFDQITLSRASHEVPRTRTPSDISQHSPSTNSISRTGYFMDTLSLASSMTSSTLSSFITAATHRSRSLSSSQRSRASFNAAGIQPTPVKPTTSSSSLGVTSFHTIASSFLLDTDASPAINPNPVNLIKPLDYVPRAALAWAPDRSLAFVVQEPSEGQVNSSWSGEIPYDDIPPRIINVPHKGLGDPIYVPKNQVLRFYRVNTESKEMFHILALGYRVESPPEKNDIEVVQRYDLEERIRICEWNAIVATDAGCQSEARVWHALIGLLKPTRERSSSTHICSHSRAGSETPRGSVLGSEGPDYWHGPVPKTHLRLSGYPTHTTHSVPDTNETTNGSILHVRLPSEDNRDVSVPPKTSRGRSDNDHAPFLVQPSEIRGRSRTTTKRKMFDLKHGLDRLGELGWIGMRQQFDSLADEGDVQLCFHLAVVAGDELRLPEWQRRSLFDSYLDLLSRLRLDSPRTYIRQHFDSEQAAFLYPLETSTESRCSRCGMPVERTDFLGSNPEHVLGIKRCCSNCGTDALACSICGQPLQDIEQIMRCHICSHGGHLECYHRYFSVSSALESKADDLDITRGDDNHDSSLSTTFSEIENIHGRSCAVAGCEHTCFVKDN